MATQKTNNPISNSKLYKWAETKIGKFTLHVVFWALFSLYLFADGYTAGEDWSCFRCFVIDNLSYLLSTMFGVYVNSYILIPKLLYNRKIVLYIISFLFVVVISSSVKVYFFNTVLSAGDVEEIGLWNTILIWFFKDIFEIFAISSIKIAFDRINTANMLKNKETQEMEAQFKYLKAQINPHFIFNTLNNIYFLTTKNSAKAGEAILSLSNILRYRIYDRTEANCTIENEIECIKELIELEKLRNDSKMEIELKVEGDHKYHKIEPLLFIPFIENAFKHCSTINDKKTIKIKFELFENSIRFYCFNSAIQKAEKKDLTASGIGIKNVQNRLKLIYPNKHQFEIIETQNSFEISILLTL